MEASELNEVLRRVIELRARAPQSIRDGSLERALRELSARVGALEFTAQAGSWQVVRRPFSGLSSEAYLLSEMAMALRLRMEQVGRAEISGLSYFYRRLDKLIADLYKTYGAGQALGPRRDKADA